MVAQNYQKKNQEMNLLKIKMITILLLLEVKNLLQIMEKMKTI
jgi:hypothetical protein